MRRRDPLRRVDGARRIQLARAAWRRKGRVGASSAARARAAHAAADKEIDGSGGDLRACRAHGLAEGAPCQAILALGLLPLARVDGRPLAAGFGLGLAPAHSPCPRCTPLAVLAPQPARLGDLAQIDVSLLELLDAARDVDRRDTMSSAAKAAAWDSLARYSPRYAKAATERRDEWLRHGEAEAARDHQLATLCPRYRADASKLARLAQLDVLSADDKETYRQELDFAYAPWPELAKCAVVEDDVVSQETWAALHGANDGMVRVRGGTFLMGSNRKEDEAAPVHSVTLPDFEIDATEITVDAYARCERAGACSRRVTYSGSDAWRCTVAGRESQDRAAANCMTFKQAAAYCHWAKKRLPTEEEWEYAARGPEARRYPWGEWGQEDGYDKYSSSYCANPSADLGYIAGSIAANTSPFGARDMAGGVWEWTSSPFSAKERVLRGGEFGWSTNDSVPACTTPPTASSTWPTMQTPTSAGGASDELREDQDEQGESDDDLLLRCDRDACRRLHPRRLRRALGTRARGADAA